MIHAYGIPQNCLVCGILQMQISVWGWRLETFWASQQDRVVYGTSEYVDWIASLVLEIGVCYKYVSHGISLSSDKWFPFLGSKACCEGCANLEAAFLVVVVS